MGRIAATGHKAVLTATAKGAWPALRQRIGHGGVGGSSTDCWLMVIFMALKQGKKAKMLR
jgi:hypothetical protein